VQDWRRSDVRRPDRLENTILAVVTTAAVCWCAVLSPAYAASPGYVPTRMGPLLAALPKGTVVFNELGVGGWLLWEHRNVSPVLDGRIDVYDPDYVERLLQARKALAGWQQTVAATGATYALLDDDVALTSALQQDLRWEVVAVDRHKVLLRSPSAL